MKKNTAFIDNWIVVSGCLLGNITGHPNQNDFSEGAQITSPIVSIDEANGTAETLNTIYTLGTRFKIKSR